MRVEFRTDDRPEHGATEGRHTSRAAEGKPAATCRLARIGDALNELGLQYHPPGSRAGLEAAVRTLSRRVLAGALPPRELALWAHSVIGHDGSPLAERLVELDDVYDCAEFGDRTLEEADAEVIAEARRITEGPSGRPTDGL